MRTFLRPGSITIYGSVEGNGHKPQVEHYPFQGLDVETEPYDFDWLQLVRAEAFLVHEGTLRVCIPAGNYKHAFQRTPLGTYVGTLRREGHDMLAAPCGLCGVNIGRCACGRGAGE